MASEPEYVLHWMPGTCSRVTLVALEEIGAEYEARLLQRGNPEAVAEYRRDVNPKGKVPALVVGGRVLTENPAIQTYLHLRHPEARLLPEDPEESLDALMMMSWFAAGLHPMINKSRFPMLTSTMPESFDSIREIACDNLRDCFGQIEARLADRDWLFDRWTIVDAYLLWLWFRAVGSGLRGEEFPRVDDLARRCQERPSTTRILDLEAETWAAIERSGHAPKVPPLQAGWLPAD